MHTNNAMLYTLLSFFIAVNFITPLIASEFDQLSADSRLENLHSELIQAENINDTVDFKYILNFLLIPFWTIDVPVWFNIMFLFPLRIVFLMILYDKIRRT